MVFQRYVVRCVMTPPLLRRRGSDLVQMTFLLLQYSRGISSSWFVSRERDVRRFGELISARPNHPISSISPNSPKLTSERPDTGPMLKACGATMRAVFQQH